MEVTILKKIMAVIPIAVLFILLSSANIALASDVGQYALIEKRNFSGHIYYVAKIYKFNSPMYVSGEWVSYTAYSGGGEGSYPAAALQAELEAIQAGNSWFTNSSGSIQFPRSNYEMVLLSGSITFANTPDTFYDSPSAFDPEIWPPPEEPSWWQNMWNELGDALGDPNFWFGEWFVDLIDNIFGNNEGGGPSEHSVTTHVQIENPTLTPAPTPIPYTTVIIPKTDPVSGDTYYETNYYYNNPSGTPIVQPYPPTNPPATTAPPNSPEYIPVGGDPYSIPVVNWLTSTTIGDTNYDGIDSVGSGLDSIDSIGSEYNDGMGAVQDATGTLPTSWLLLIGIAAAILLIAGIISRFLS